MDTTGSREGKRDDIIAPDGYPVQRSHLIAAFEKHRAIALARPGTRRLLAALGALRAGPAPVAEPEPAEVEAATGDELTALLLRFAPTLRALVARLAGELRPYLLTATGGAGDEFDLRSVSGVFATAVGARPSLAWRSTVFDATDRPLLLCCTAGDDPAAAGVVRFEDGRVVVRADHFPEDGRWRLFCLSGTDDPLTAVRFEGFALHRPAPPGAAPLAPVELLSHGFVGDAWQAALEQGWGDAQLAQLVLLACGKMHALWDVFQATVTPDQYRERLAALVPRIDLRVRHELDGRKDLLFAALRSFAAREAPPA